MKPIIFNTEMAKAILDGRKIQARGAFSKYQLKVFDYALQLGEINSLDNLHENDFSYILQFSKYKVGDILYVREPAKIIGNHKQIGNIYERTCNFKYLADDKIVENFNIPYRLSASHINQFLYKNMKGTWLTGNKGVPIGCIKEMARIFLKVTNIRVERLQDITAINMDSDMGTISPIISKLIAIDDYIKLQNKYKKYWNSTAKDGYKWEDNPYVFVYEFKRIEK